MGDVNRTVEGPDKNPQRGPEEKLREIDGICLLVGEGDRSCPPPTDKSLGCEHQLAKVIRRIIALDKEPIS